MKLAHTIALSISLALLSPARSRAQANDPLFTASKQQLAVVKVVLAQQSEWNKGELDTYLSHFKNAPDTEVMLGNPIKGFANIRNAFHTLYPNHDAMGDLENSEVEVRELGENFALATGNYRLQRNHKAGGELRGTFSEVFERTPEGWKVIFSESL